MLKFLTDLNVGLLYVINNIAFSYLFSKFASLDSKTLDDSSNYKSEDQ